MYLNSKIVKIFAIITAFLLLLTVGLIIFIEPKTDVKDPSDIPTANRLLYGVKFVGETQFDFKTAKENVLQNGIYSGYNLRDEYTNIFQIIDQESEEKIKSDLGITSELPNVDYSEKYLLLSVGKKIFDLEYKNQRIDRDGLPVLNIEYEDGEYFYGKIFVYLMNTKKISSGQSLEYYMWENADQMSNLVFDDAYGRQTVSEGQYHLLYVTNDKKYYYDLYSADKRVLKRRGVSDNPVTITEYGSTIISVQNGDKTVYYHPQKDKFSEEYTFPTGYLIYNIITYMRVNNGEIQLILRDAYDKNFYAKIVRLPFSQDTDNLHSLVKSVEVIDNTSVWVEYYKGESKELVKEAVDVYNLKR